LDATDYDTNYAFVRHVLRGRQIPALIAVFEPAGTAVTLQRNTEMVRPDRHPEFS
jgi:predicted small integral membrane protein